MVGQPLMPTLSIVLAIQLALKRYLLSLCSRQIEQGMTQTLMVGKPLMPNLSASALLPSAVQSYLASVMGVSVFALANCLAAASHSGVSFCWDNKRTAASEPAGAGVR